jgi:hypothetical protein
MKQSMHAKADIETNDADRSTPVFMKACAGMRQTQHATYGKPAHTLRCDAHEYGCTAKGVCTNALRKMPEAAHEKTRTYRYISTVLFQRFALTRHRKTFLPALGIGLSFLLPLALIPNRIQLLPVLPFNVADRKCVPTHL